MIQAKIETWKKEIENNTGECLVAFGTLDEQTLNTKPNTQTWSIAQVLDHLIKTNESYYKVLEEIKSGKARIPIWGKIGFVNNFFGDFILKSVQPETPRKVKTLPIWEPIVSDIKGIIPRFEQAQKELASFIEANAASIENNMLISSPAAKAIVYKFPKVIDILVAHEKRHLKQAKNILATIKK